MIKVKNLTKNFANFTAIKGLDFAVKKGEVLGFLGPNGAGKTTTIKIIAGFLEASSGEVLIDNEEFSKNPISIKKKIGYMPENTPLYNEMTTREYLKFMAQLYGVEQSDLRVNEVLELGNLKDVENKLVENLSKGYKSRLSFASAIIHDPPILLLDEPTDGLDPNQKNEIRKLIKQLSANKAIIVSTHILEEVEAMCSKIIIISEGKIVLDGTIEDLRKKSESKRQVVASFDAENLLKAQKIYSDISLLDQDSSYYIWETDLSLDSIVETFYENKVFYKEIFKYKSSLDEAFRKITKTKE